MKNDINGELEAIINDRGLLSGPRPSIDRPQLQHHLQEVLRLLHVDLADENLLDDESRFHDVISADAE